jgi:hypothetical protein
MIGPVRSLAITSTGRGRAAAIASLDASVEAFATALEAMPEPDLTGGEWGPREVLCHLVYWHATDLSIARPLNAGERPRLLVGSFPEFNRRAVIQLGSVPVPELARRLRLAQKQLAVELLALRPGARIRIKAGSMARGPVEFATRIDAHIRGHLVEITRARRRGRSLPA